jgi:hypothetical protein
MAIGAIMFAGIMMAVNGIFSAIAGLVALAKDEFYVVLPNYLVVGILVASLSAIANFAFIPYYPVWSLLIIAIDVVVIWALAAHGRQMSSS